MPAAQSMMLPLGTFAPPFALPDVDGQIRSLPVVGKTKGLLVAFICNHCPYVIHLRAGLAALGRDLLLQGVMVVGINANDAQRYAEDAPENMRAEAVLAGYTFPYLYDESQSVARAYGAKCTPDFFLFDQKLKLVYRGQMDDSRPGNGVSVTGYDIRAAGTAMLAGTAISLDQKPSVGCSIKWKSGH
jgi:peroxiredoxin